MTDVIAGNQFSTTGEIPLTAGETPIPYPPAGFGTARITVTAPSGEDMYIGPIGACFHRVPANTSQWFTVRTPLFVSTVPQGGPVSSSSSSSSISAANSMTYFYEWT